MTDEREKSGRDALVADVYRELADERTPRELDDKVLRMAARDGRTRYSLVRGWMRPLAWAATIALSLAIVMELTLFSNMDPDYASPAATEPLADRPEAKEVTPSTPGQTAPSQLRQDAPGDAGELVPQAVTIVRDAEALARVQAGPDRPDIASEEVQEAPQAESASSRAFAASAVSTAAVAIDTACSSEEREEADSWHACIERLREEGLDELAAREDDAFREEYPDYEATAGDR